MRASSRKIMSAPELVRIRGSAFAQPRYGIIQILIVDDPAEVGAPLLQAELEEPVLVGFETLDLESSVWIETRRRDPPEQGDVLDRRMLGENRVDAVAVDPVGDGIEIGARALEVRDHPALGGLALICGEFRGVDDPPILTCEREEVFHPLPAHRDVAGSRKRDERLEQRSTVDRLVAKRGNHFRQSELDEFDFVRLNPAELERLAELGGAGDAFPHDRELAALQVLEVLDGVGEIAANDDGGKAESLGNLSLVGHELHSDAARASRAQRES